MPKGYTNAIRIGNLHLATARLPSHIHQSKSTVQGLVSFFTGYPPPKGSYLNIVLPTEYFLSFSTFLPLVNQGIHFFGFCFFHSFLLESYKGFNNAETCSWSGGYVDVRQIPIHCPLLWYESYRGPAGVLFLFSHLRSEERRVGR